jgi:hypothetical protein
LLNKTEHKMEEEEEELFEVVSTHFHLISAVAGVFVAPTASGTTLRPTQPRIHWVSGGIFPSGKAAGV